MERLWFIKRANRQAIETVANPELFERDWGWIYFIQEGFGGPIKIGFSRNPEWRIPSLQTGNSNELRLLGKFRGTKRDEMAFHKAFLEYRIRGEWFKPILTLLRLGWS